MADSRRKRETRNEKLSLSHISQIDPQFIFALIVKNTTKAHLAVFFTNLFFAANFSLVKIISPVFIKPFGLNILRVGISMVLFWLMWALEKTPVGIKRKDIGRFVLCGLTGIAINQMLFVKGLTMTTSIHASLLMLTTPILITLFALWVLKESMTLIKAAGLLLGICGAVFLIATKETSFHAPNYLWGDLLILTNAISYSIYFILVKPLMKDYSPLQVVRWIFTIGFFMILPFGWNETIQINFASFEYKNIIALACIILTGTFLAYYFNAYGLQHLGAGITGSYIYLQPVFAVIIASFFFDEIFTWQKLLAASLIFGGVYLVSFKKTGQKEATTFVS